ncbi:MAG: sulfite exporter TauE/SafE family protein [Candidatus Nanopelagicales bacterium]
MVPLLLVALAGFSAQMVDGSLGMGYGLTSATLLIAIGLSPVMASASVNLAQIGTTAVSGFSHGKLGNVDKVVFRRIAIPGAIGAFTGALVLVHVSTNLARPWASSLLLLLGIYVLWRYLAHRRSVLRKGRPRTQFLAPLGLIGGFVNSTGGGGWGPVSTPALLATGRMAPNRVIGTVNAAEFVVTLAAVSGFFVGLGLGAADLRIVLPLMLGGMIAAPFAAWIAKRLPMRIMGVAVGGLIIITNSITLLRAFGVEQPIASVTLAVLGLLWITTVALVTVQHFTAKRVADELAAIRQPESV